MAQFKSIMIKCDITYMEEQLKIFESEVTNAINDNWKLHGGTTVIKDVYSVYMIQFVTKEK